MNKEARKKRISEYVAHFMSLGWNKVQATSLAWIEEFEEFMDSRSGQGNGFFGPSVTIDCYCKDCEQGCQVIPSTARMFIQNHKDHDTKTIKIRK